MPFSIEGMFDVEIGRVRTIAEVKARLEELRFHGERERELFDKACNLPFLPGLHLGGPERRAALEVHDEEYPDGTDLQIALDALTEIIPDLEAQGFVDLAVVEPHIRNSRHWQGMFGSESYLRIDVFSWIAGVEPNHDPLEDESEQEKLEHERQIESMVEGIKKALSKDEKVN